MNEQNYQDSANLSNLILNSASKQRKEKQEEEKTMLTSFEQATTKKYTHTQKKILVYTSQLQTELIHMRFPGYVITDNPLKSIRYELSMKNQLGFTLPVLLSL